MNDNSKQISDVLVLAYDENNIGKRIDSFDAMATALDTAVYRKQNDTVCPMCLDCPNNCLLEWKHPMTREQVRAETAKEFAEKAISEVFEKITQRFCDIYYSGLNRECPDSILSEHYQSAFDECKEIVKNSIAEIAASFGTEVEE